MATGCFITPGRSLERAVQLVRLAEELGYDAVFTTHIAGWESLAVLGAYAAQTERIALGTGVVPIYTRTPATMAQTAATLDELSGGRLRLGLGVSHQVVVENWHGQRIERPVAEMAEYVGIVKAILGGRQPPEGSKWRTNFRLVGVEPRPNLPIYIAALSPRMLQLAGEVGDGVLLWLCVPDYILEVVLPAVRRGRERAGKELDGFQIVPAVPAALVGAEGERERIYDALRGELLTYFSLPFYRAMLARAGFGPELEAFDRAAGAVEQMKAAISNRFLDCLCAVGSAAELEEGLGRYREAGATLPCVGPASAAAVEATLRAAMA